MSSSTTDSTTNSTAGKPALFKRLRTNLKHVSKSYRFHLNPALTALFLVLLSESDPDLFDLLKSLFAKTKRLLVVNGTFENQFVYNSLGNHLEKVDLVVYLMQNKRFSDIHKLVDLGMNVQNEYRYRKLPLLHAVAKFGDFDLFEFLIQKGTDWQSGDLLYTVVSSGCVKMAEFLLSHGCSVNRDHLKMAINRQDMEILQLLDENTHPHDKREWYQSLTNHTVVPTLNVEIFKFVQERGEVEWGWRSADYALTTYNAPALRYFLNLSVRPACYIFGESFWEGKDRSLDRVKFGLLCGDCPTYITSEVLHYRYSFYRVDTSQQVCILNLLLMFGADFYALHTESHGSVSQPYRNLYPEDQKRVDDFYQSNLSLHQRCIIAVRHKKIEIPSWFPQILLVPKECQPDYQF